MSRQSAKSLMGLNRNTWQAVAMGIHLLGLLALAQPFSLTLFSFSFLPLLSGAMLMAATATWPE